MRKYTLYIVCVLIGFVFHEIGRAVLDASGISLPFWQKEALLSVAATVLTLFSMYILERFNRRLLEWRKARGRDIEDEERYESDLIAHGMISLNPRQETISKNELEK